MEGFSRLLNYLGNVKAPIMSKIVGISLEKFLRLTARRAQVCGNHRRFSPASLVTVLRRCVRLRRRHCEAHHMRIAAAALLLWAAGGGLSGIAAMTTRRIMYWWFRFVLSGRFLDRFLCLPRAQ
jgi:hypothetical protein